MKTLKSFALNNVAVILQAAIILLAVLADSIRTGRLEKMTRRLVTSGRVDE